MLYFGWIIAAFLLGVIVTLPRMGKGDGLQQRSELVGSFQGMRYDEVIECLRKAPQRTVQRTNGETLRQWQEGRYSISLLFDRGDICLGVEEEKTARGR